MKLFFIFFIFEFFKLSYLKLITIHFIPHSHDDVGWLCTPEEYFKGCQKGNVTRILNSVLNNINSDEQFTFSQVEVYFLEKFWENANETQRQEIKDLVNEKRLEFVNGGYVMNDEGAAYYEDIIDQFTVGHKFLKDNFNYVPKVGWSIDPFGHSAGMAQIISDIGFQGWAIERIPNNEETDIRQNKKSFEWIWKPSENAQMFTKFNFLPYYKGLGQGEILQYNDCPFTPIEPEVLKAFINQINEILKDKSYNTNQISYQIGGDFLWYAQSDYYRVKDLINLLNEQKNVTNIQAKFSTPSIYLKALNDELQNSQKMIPSRYDDFMPYSDNEIWDGIWKIDRQNSFFWSGYYSSRPELKFIIRNSGRYLQAARKLLIKFQIFGLSSYFTESPEILLNDFEKAMAVCQHHDAITGTSKYKVVQDYISMLEMTKNKLQLVINSMLKEFMQTQIQGPQIQGFQECEYVFYKDDQQEKSCTNLENAIKNQQLSLLTVYNPGQLQVNLLKIESNILIFDIFNGVQNFF